MSTSPTTSPACSPSTSAPEHPDDALRLELAALLNRHSRERRSNTPDFLLAELLLRTLEAGEHLVSERDGWYGRDPVWPIRGQREMAESLALAVKDLGGGRLNPDLLVVALDRIGLGLARFQVPGIARIAFKAFEAPAAPPPPRPESEVLAIVEQLDARCREALRRVNNEPGSDSGVYARALGQLEGARGAGHRADRRGARKGARVNSTDTSDPAPSCAHLHVERVVVDNEGGTKSVHWACRDCKAHWNLYADFNVARVATLEADLDAMDLDLEMFRSAIDVQLVRGEGDATDADRLRAIQAARAGLEMLAATAVSARREAYEDAARAIEQLAKQHAEAIRALAKGTPEKALGTLLATVKKLEDQLPRTVAGALFDFAGYLTTRPEEFRCGGPVTPHDVLQHLEAFAAGRGLNLDEAMVGDWTQGLTREAPRGEG